MSVGWGGGIQHRIPNITNLVAREDDDNDGWDLPPPPAAGATATDKVMLPPPSTSNGDYYNDKESRQFNERGRWRTRTSQWSGSSQNKMIVVTYDIAFC